MRMRRNHHLPGHYILYEGDEVDTLHLIKKGRIEILVGGVPKGKMGKYFENEGEQSSLKLTCFVFPDTVAQQFTQERGRGDSTSYVR
jgi:CRP-like cAMP-binding protein